MKIIEFVLLIIVILALIFMLPWFKRLKKEYKDKKLHDAITRSKTWK